MLADSTSLRNPFLKPISSYVFQLNIFRNLIQVIFPIQFVFAIQINTFFPIQLFIKILKKNRREVFKQNRCENIQILFSILNSTKLVFNGSWLGVVADYYYKCLFEAHSSNIAQMFLRSTSARHYAKPLLCAVFSCQRCNQYLKRFCKRPNKSPINLTKISITIKVYSLS